MTDQRAWRRGQATEPGAAALRSVRTALLPVLLSLATLVTGCDGAGAPEPAKRGATAGTVGVPVTEAPVGGPVTGSTTGAPATTDGPSRDVLVAALLGPAELGAGWREGGSPAEAPPWPWLQTDCPAYRDGDYPAQRHRRDAVQRRYQHESSQQAAMHVVEAYQAGWAVRALDDVRRVVRICSRYAAWGGTISFTVLHSRLRAEEGVLVLGRIEAPGAPERFTLFLTVRRGDLLSTLNVPGPMDEWRAYETAEKLVDLLG
ncbi:hypothetical protein [Plantactinospora sonchi]|uniref:Lipoprotein n=1 Tax=Plantactinospora sonchi TaxID=1544735 RepID=A0ABU7RQB1_9ACTN